MSALLKLILKIEEEGTFSNSFYETSITMIGNPDKELQTNIPYQYR